MSTNRYVVVGFDKATGDMFISPEMLKAPYTKAEAEYYLQEFSKTLTELRSFMVLPHDQALQLLIQEQHDDDPRKDKRVIN